MKCVGARIAVRARLSGSSASQIRAASAPSSSCGASCTCSSPCSASRARPSFRCSTAAFSAGSRWRRISSISAVATPASWSARNGSPALAARSWRRSPTSTSRAMCNRSAIRISSSICTVETIEASSSTSTEPSKSRRSRATRAPSPRSPWRVRNHCSVRAPAPVSSASTRAAAADGASRIALRSPSSPSASFSMVVLPVPAAPCTATIPSWDSRIVRTASRCPSVSAVSASRSETRSSSAIGRDAPSAWRLWAMIPRSRPSASEVTNDRPLGTWASTRWPSAMSPVTAASISPSSCRPGACPSAIARMSVSRITEARSARCSTARQTTSRALSPGGSGRNSSAVRT